MACEGETFTKTVSVSQRWTSVYLHRQVGIILTSYHLDCCLDVEWLSDEIFASAGADQRIFIMRVDEDEPIKMLQYEDLFIYFL